MTSRLSVSLLGPLEATLDGEPLGGFGYNKVRALLAYLAVEADRPHTRGSLCALLWPDLPENAARQNLSQALTQLRKLLENKQVASTFLLATTETVQLNPAAPLDVDVARFTALIAAAEAHFHRAWHLCSPCAARLRQAVGLYRGDFLAHFYLSDSAPFEEWALLLRERLRQRMLSALERLIQYAEWRGAFEQAAELAWRHVAMEPLRDVGHRQLMRLLALGGQQGAALAQYDYLRRTLAAELEIEPEPETAALYQQIRGGNESPERRLQAPENNLPAPPAPLVGRETDLDAIGGLLQNGARLVTLTGPPGVGKTRLALELAHRLRYDFEDGVTFLELAPLLDATQVPPAVALALGVKEQPGRTAEETVRAYLQSRHCLLVLDNFEHVDEAALFVAALLAACPHLSMLVTSRSPLRVRIEQQYHLAPLAESEAVQLFKERAGASGAAPAHADEDGDAIVALCRQLDYLPLAIELVAVHTRSFSAAELLKQLQLTGDGVEGRRLEALPLGSRDLPQRQQSLRNAIAWSYDRLTGDEQRLFAHLGVFAGGYVADAVQAVVGEGLAVPFLLEGLVETSLVQSGMTAGDTRFTLLETIREFALEQLLETGFLPKNPVSAANEARRRHAEYFAGLSMTAYTELIGPEGERWLQRIAAEQDNIRLAFQFAMEQSHYETALRLATGVWRFHWMRGLFREGLERLETTLAHRDSLPLDLQSNAMRAAGTLAIGLGDYESARRWLEQAVELGRHLPGARVLQPALTNLGFALLEQGEVEAARLALEESLDLARRDEDPYVIKFPLSLLGGLAFRQGDFAQAQAFREESLRLNRAIGDREGTADSLFGLGQAVNAQGDYDLARQLAEEALALHRTLNHQLGVGNDHALLGDIARDQGAYEEALQHYRRCLSLWSERENAANNAYVLDDIALILSRMGKLAPAAKLLGAADTLRQRAQVKLTPFEQANRESLVADSRTALGIAAFDEAWAQGQAMTIEEAVAMALSEEGN